jgi:hypothetical protein
MWGGACGHKLALEAAVWCGVKLSRRAVLACLSVQVARCSQSHHGAKHNVVIVRVQYVHEAMDGPQYLSVHSLGIHGGLGEDPTQSSRYLWKMIKRLAAREPPTTLSAQSRGG